MTAAHVQPALIAWAAERSGRDRTLLEAKWPHYPEWLSGERQPSLADLEAFAKYTHAPFGYFFLPEPPEEPLPIPDFRTMADRGLPARPSADLLDTIYACQLRQQWYRDYVQREELSRPDFVGSVAVGADVRTTAAAIVATLSFDMERRASLRGRDAVRAYLIKALEARGVLTTVTGTVGSDTHRLLNPEEFRGFTLFDPVAPLVFVNGRDTTSAQIFTLVHEVAHVWAGDSGLSDADPFARTSPDPERWANRVAAEVLVPSDVLTHEYRGAVTPDELARLADLFTVSSLVILTSLHDGGHLGWDDYRRRYEDERRRLAELAAERKPSSGGNYCNAQPYKVGGHPLVWAVVTDTLSGSTLYTDAYSLLGVSAHSTFEALAEKVLR